MGMDIGSSTVSCGLNSQQNASKEGEFSQFWAENTDSEAQKVGLTNISCSRAAPFVLWGPINFIRRNRRLYQLVKGLRSIKRNGIKALVKIAPGNKRRYLSSLETETQLTKGERSSQENTVFPKQIKISVITPLYNTQEQALREMIESIMAQTYHDWELCLADGSDGDHEGAKRTCINYGQKDNRIKYIKLDRNLGIPGNSNKAIEMSSGEYIGVLGHNDVLHPSALYEVMKAICHEGADFVYTDEAAFSGNRAITLKHHKPDYAFDTLCSCNYISNFAVFGRKIMDQAGTFRTEFEGSHDYDLILRYTGIAGRVCHIPKLLYFSRELEKPVASVAGGENVIEEYLKKRCIPAKVENKKGLSGFYRVNYELVEKPKVSIIIPNRDNVPLLRNCLSSIMEKTSYSNYEIIIVDNNSTKDIVFAY
jgi:glycosyltransferase involved in cell wall biosynthesis